MPRIDEVASIVLSSGFAESNTRVPFDAGFPEDQNPFTEEFDYESDSDLEDDAELSTSMSNLNVDIRSAPASSPSKAVEPSSEAKGLDEELCPYLQTS